MNRRTAGAALAAALVVAAAALIGYAGGLFALPGQDQHDRAAVILVDADGSKLAVVDARVADTRTGRIRGLSETESLENGTGMLFVHDREARQTYVMRGMSFPLDIVFIAANGTVTAIHSAPVPPDDADQLPRYAGLAKYVLEVPRGYADAVGLDVGDRVRVRYRD